MICSCSTPAGHCRRRSVDANAARHTARAWKYDWPNVYRTIHGWRFCFANKAIRSAADCARGCKSSLQKDSPQPYSTEMPSAGRAFTWKLLLDLKRRGIESAYIVLHTGLSSYMDDELDRAHPASEEEYFVSRITAEKVNSARENGGRIIAVGTTVARALESVADSDGCVGEKQGYTRLKINGQHRLKVVNGLLTGLHEPEASHLDLLSAFLSAEKIRAAYEEAIARKYLWHEFGDLNLIL